MDINENSAPAIRMRNMDKFYGRYHGLKSISLDIAKGERIVVCDPSGSGKSTMIRCINALEKHQAGLRRLWAARSAMTALQSTLPDAPPEWCSRTSISFLI